MRSLSDEEVSAIFGCSFFDAYQHLKHNASINFSRIELGERLYYVTLLDPARAADPKCDRLYVVVGEEIEYEYQKVAYLSTSKPLVCRINVKRLVISNGSDTIIFANVMIPLKEGVTHVMAGRIK